MERVRCKNNFIFKWLGFMSKMQLKWFVVIFSFLISGTLFLWPLLGDKQDALVTNSVIASSNYYSYKISILLSLGANPLPDKYENDFTGSAMYFAIANNNKELVGEYLSVISDKKKKLTCQLARSSSDFIIKDVDKHKDIVNYVCLKAKEL
jgi:hypothetical protein